jgi:hypothetical protein
MQMKYLSSLLFITLLNTTAMAKEIRTEIHINTGPEKVWAILTNFKDYPNWNPFIRSINGEVIVGQKITACIEPPGASGMTFKPRVLIFNTNKEFRWQGRLFMSGVFDGEHIFQLKANTDGTTTFIQSEKFKGILVPLFKRMINENTMAGFQLMNTKLKELAELDSQ